MFKIIQYKTKSYNREIVLMH